MDHFRSLIATVAGLRDQHGECRHSPLRLSPEPYMKYILCILICLNVLVVPLQCRAQGSGAVPKRYSEPPDFKKFQANRDPSIDNSPKSDSEQPIVLLAESQNFRHLGTVAVPIADGSDPDPMLLMLCAVRNPRDPKGFSLDVKGFRAKDGKLELIFTESIPQETAGNMLLDVNRSVEEETKLGS